MVQDAIEALLRQKIGLDADSIGSRTITHAVEQRRLKCGLPDRAAYFLHLQTSLQELENLIETVVVPETWFFRDREPFVYLSQFVTQWRLTHPKRIFRVLSAPCSTGEEPYSIAITLLNAGLTPTQFHIDAMDISKRSLLKATQGLYRKTSFRGGGLPEQSRYFQPVDNGQEIRPFVRDTVTFQSKNLLHSGLFAEGVYHTIFCRNLLIYLDRNSRNQLIQTLDRALAPSGLLFVGASETSQVTAQHFVPIPHSFAFGYQKQTQVADQSLPTLPLPLQEAPAPVSVQQAAPVVDRVDLATAKQLANQGRLTAAIVMCQSHLKAHPTDAQAYVLLGEIHQGLNQPDQAEQAFQKAMYLNPSAYEAMTHLALLKEQKGDRTGATLLRQRIQRLLKTQLL